MAGNKHPGVACQSQVSILYFDPIEQQMQVNQDHRVRIFIDGSNLYHGLKAVLGNTKIDFTKFINKLCAGRRLLRAYYYNTQFLNLGMPSGIRDSRDFSAHCTMYHILK